MTEPRWLTIARADLGTREIEGPKSNSRIVAYAKRAIGVERPDSEAWCAYFVGAILADAGLDGTGKVNARSYLDWGRELERPQPGCVVIFWRGSPKSWQGHVGFWLREDGTHCWVLGGNQGNAVSIAKYRRDQVLGYRWPAEAVAPVPRPAADAGLREIQARLKALGYHEVGAADGRWGSKTRGAIRAFVDDWNERQPGAPLPVVSSNAKADLVTDVLRAALMKALPRSVAPERETAGPERIDDYAAEREPKRVGLFAKIAAWFAALWGADEATGVSEKLGEASEAVYSVRSIFDALWPIVQPLLPFLILGAAVAVIVYLRRVRKEEIESYRMGETP